MAWMARDEFFYPLRDPSQKCLRCAKLPCLESRGRAVQRWVFSCVKPVRTPS